MREEAQPNGERMVFHSLDLLRGIAAIAVAAKHFGIWLADFLPNGHLAVDLFFLLSGLVLSSAYEQRIRDGLGPFAFMKVRLIRLYPMYALGSMLSIAVLLARQWHLGEAIHWSNFAMSFWFGALFVPVPGRWSFNGHSLYPFNFPAWSLCWELVVNFAFVLFLRRLTWPVLGAIIGVGLLLVVHTANQYGSLDVGSNAGDWMAGPQRVVFPFFMGVLLFRVWQANRLAWLRLPSWTVAVLLLFVLSLRPGSRAIYDVVVVTIIFPVIVLSATGQPSARVRQTYRWLGAVSYPVYALHASYYPLVLLAVDGMMRWSFPARYASETAILLGTIGIAWLADRYIDKPVRAWLSARAAARVGISGTPSSVAQV
jgi:peptidoglycan/LPS O-acetylase OafA/YrhL